MARKERSISSFDQVASDSNINNNNESEKNSNAINDILNVKKTKDQTHIFKGYYLENKVADTIDKITEDRPKGVKSELVNEILKKYFKDEGLM